MCVDFRDLNKACPKDDFSERGIEVDPNKIKAIKEMLAPKTEKDV